VHEFTKVELFAWTMPEFRADVAFGPALANDGDGASHAEAVFDEIISIQTEVLQSLGLYCRVLEMPTADLGASATRKRDIEAYFPSRWDKDEGWGEVTSTSLCTDYQTRRLGTRIKSTASGHASLVYPYTVNGTALAVPRVLAAILEVGWDEEEKLVKIPEVLWPWMAGVKSIRKKT
jgi:seryl-tRNA synthetase